MAAGGKALGAKSRFYQTRDLVVSVLNAFIWTVTKKSCS
jgi:hypothetical protein